MVLAHAFFDTSLQVQAVAIAVSALFGAAVGEAMRMRHIALWPPEDQSQPGRGDRKGTLHSKVVTIPATSPKRSCSEQMARTDVARSMRQ